MGLFNFFKKKEEKWIEIYAPVNGIVIPLSEVPDEAFAFKMIGDGCAIIPKEGAIYAPIDGEIDIFETNHAVSIEAFKNFEMIVHFGIDTVKLNGKGLKRITEIGNVKKGDKLIEYDLGYIKKNAKSIITPVVITNMDIVKKIDVVVDYDHHVKAGDLLMKVLVR